MASRSTRSTGTRKMIVGMTLVGHERSFYYTSDGERREDNRDPTIAYFPDGQKIISGSRDKTTRLWDLQAGKEIEEARVVCEQEVDVVAVSSDGRWIVTGLRGELKVKANEVKTGSVKTFEGHSLGITCIDISVDCKLLASRSRDDTVRIWSLDTGELVAGPFGTGDFSGGAGTVRFSHDSRKLAAKSEFDSYLQVWDIQAQKLDNEVGNRRNYLWFYYVPVFWTTKDRTIVTSFSFTDDPAKAIYEFDSSTLETVGTPFEGHTDRVFGLALSSDSTLLASASFDGIKLWAFESRQLIASFDNPSARSLVLSPDSRKLAYMTYAQGPPKIYICDIPPDILASVWPAQEAVKPIEREHSQLTDQFNSDAARRPATVHRHLESSRPSRRPRRPSPTIYPHQSTFIGHLRKLLPFSFGLDAVPRVRIDEAHDPLDLPATLHLPPNDSAHIATQTPPQSRSQAAASTILAPARPSTIRSGLRHISNWWPVRTGHALPPIVDVPLAQGKERNAAAGARKGNVGYRRDEDFDTPPPPPNSDPQGTSAPMQIDAGEHPGGCLCFRL